jgi:hexosaminidase
LSRLSKKPCDFKGIFQVEPKCAHSVAPNDFETMKLIVVAILLTSIAGTALGAMNEPALIPQPQKMERLDGEFKLSEATRIFADRGSAATAEYLAARLRPPTGHRFKVSHKIKAGAPMGSGILLTTNGADATLGAEGYELDADAHGVVIRAPSQAGLFYGVQTLLQLLPPEIFSSNAVAGVEWVVPGVRIADWPRFRWRGLMLDVSRHFYTPAEVETMLDLMALHKLNTFHWHLVDEPGWRIEIKKYPKLTQVGAWRDRCELMPPAAGTNAHPAWAQPAPSKFGPDGRYGGFYTQKEIRQVVAYAAERHIQVVPEIEMPGHSTAAISAYPEFGCVSGFDKNGRPVHTSIYDPSNEGTFRFLDDVLTEVFALFPGPYIHLGGDEVDKRYWMQNASCQALMKREGLKNGEELQSWFIRRMETFVNAHGKTLIGWSEILQGGLATNAVVMDWIGGGREAASMGHDVVMSPENSCYLDHYQSTNVAAEPRAIGGYTPLHRIYLLDPIPTNLPAEFQSHVLGAQGNLWTEYVASLPHVEYMVFPRLTALAEVDWSARESRNWDDFVSRLQVHERRLDALKVNYRPGASEP